MYSLFYIVDYFIHRRLYTNRLLWKSNIHPVQIQVFMGEFFRFLSWAYGNINFSLCFPFSTTWCKNYWHCCYIYNIYKKKKKRKEKGEGDKTNVCTMRSSKQSRHMYTHAVYFRYTVMYSIIIIFRYTMEL